MMTSRYPAFWQGNGLFLLVRWLWSKLAGKDPINFDYVQNIIELAGKTPVNLDSYQRLRWIGQK
jgi:hypothetical protein